MAKILVTGGAGFIGSHIVDAYLAAGHTVSIIDDLSTGSRENINPKASFHEVDIRSEAVKDVFAQEQPEVVTHLAAHIDVRRSVEEPLFDADINIRGGLNILENCVKSKVRKVLFASTGGAIYGVQKVLPSSETSNPEPECHYATSKLSFEHYLALYNRLYKLDYTILRYPNVYGPRQRPDGEAGVCSILAGLMLDGKTPTLFGHGTPLRDYVYVEDIARGNVLALDKGSCQILNLGSGKGTSVRELFDALKSALNFEGDPILADLRPGEVQENYITGDLAREVLGWEPKMPLDQGLKETVAYIKAQRS